MRVLITGGAGFIGSHLAEALVLQGHEVTALDDLSGGGAEYLRALRAHASFRHVLDSVTNASLVSELTAASDVVFHLAGASAPASRVDARLLSTGTVLRAAGRTGTRVVLASSAAVYGRSENAPFHEDSALVVDPRQAGRTTSAILDELFALGVAAEYDAALTVVRLFGPCGPRVRSGEGTIVSAFVKQAMAGEPIVVPGNGLHVRSFAWIGDVVWALEALAKEPRAAGQVFNVGSAEEIALRDLAELVRSTAGSRSEIVCTPVSAGTGDLLDAPRSVADLTKVRRLIAFEPRVSLSGILANLIEEWRPQAMPPASTPMHVRRVGSRLIPSGTPGTVAAPLTIVPATLGTARV